MSEHGREGEVSDSAKARGYGKQGDYVPPRTHADIVALRDRIVARYDKATGSNATATHGPLVEAILSEMFPVRDEPGSSTEAP